MNFSAWAKSWGKSWGKAWGSSQESAQSDGGGFFRAAPRSPMPAPEKKRDIEDDDAEVCAIIFTNCIEAIL